MTHDPLANLDRPVCDCDRCLGRLEWPDWAAPQSEWRKVEDVKVDWEKLEERD